METLDLIRWLHILGATVLIGTGSGIAFFMVMAHRTSDPHLIAHTAGIVVLADWIFTASAVVIQPITGILLATVIGWELTTPWVALSLALYLVIGAFWVPVVFIQKRMQKLAELAVKEGSQLSGDYHRLFRIWFLCGIPAFGAIIIILWLMVARPEFL